MPNDQSNSIPLKICLTAHSKSLLEEIVDERYASRSEAIRAAIEHHHRYLSDGGETDLDVLREAIDEVADRIDNTQSELEELNSGVVYPAHGMPSQATDDQESDSTPSVRQPITEELVQDSPLGVEELADRTQQSKTAIRQSITQLKDDSLVERVETDPATYELNTE